MAFSSGDKLGHFEVVAALGSGGMGEVYRARDTRLDRTVAIKVLHGLLSGDPTLRERFEREARAVSSLNHPNICTLYDIGSEGGVDFLVMEHLEGEDLAQRLMKGPLPLELALRYGVEIADALDKAHRQGVVHRDLKPGNVMLTPAGAKLLDFGLAKLEPSLLDSDSESSASALPTAGRPLTEKGAILGTFQYMAPEQLEQGEVDARTDIFAFGAVLYEMLTGQRAFSGKSQASLITAIMSGEPTSIVGLQPMTPPLLEHLVERCLSKDRESRWQTARDLKLELEWIRERGAQLASGSPAAPARLGRERWVWVLAMVLAAGVSAIMGSIFMRSPEAPLTRTTISLPTPLEIDDRQDSFPMALSPDGRRLAYLALGGGEGSRIFLRALDSFEARPLPGTEGGINPFFSPDGQWVGFFAQGKLLKVSVEGGAPIPIADAPFGSFAADWAEDGSILFDQAFARGSLLRVSADGGLSEPFTLLPASGGVVGHQRPRLLPGDRGLLLDVVDTEGAQAAVRDADSGEIRLLRGIPSGAHLLGVLRSGHLVYSHGGGLWAVAFDLDRLEVRGAPTIVLEGIYTTARTEYLAISEAGVLVYAAGEGGGEEGPTLAWADREGRVTPSGADSAGYLYPRLSPDGRRVVVNDGDGAAWIFDLERGTRIRLAEISATPLWTPDGGRVVYSTREGIFSRPADGSGQADLHFSAREGSQYPMSFSPDGRSLVIYEMHPATGRDIWMIPPEGEPVPLAVTEASERSARVSPNGRWMAYVSDESGRDEIYVQAFPGPGGKRVISTEGGREPVWSRDGKELFYRRADELISVPFATDGELQAGTPRTLFTGRFAVAAGGRNQNYDVSPDGERFLFVQRGEGVPRELRVVVNWLQELDRLVPR